MICIDVAFLKTFLHGCLLTAIRLDVGNQMFLIARTITEGANNDSREWFLSNLQACLRGKYDFRWTLILDEHRVKT